MMTVQAGDDFQGEGAKSRRLFSLFFRLSVSVAVFWYLTTKFDFGRILVQLTKVNLVWLVFSLIVAGVMYVAAAFRWRRVARALDVKLAPGNALRIFMIGMFFSQVLLGTIGGDAVRVWLSRKHTPSLRTAFNSTLFDRVSGLLTISLVMIASFPIYFRVIPDRLSLLALLIPVGIIACAMVFMLWMDRFPLPASVKPLVASAAKISEDARHVFLTPRDGLAVIAYSLGVLILTCLVVYSMGQSLGLPVSVPDCLSMVPPVMLVTAVPVSIGGWGVREGAMVVAFGFLGLGGEQALMLSVWFGLILMAASLPGGPLWLFALERKSGEGVGICS